MSNLLEDASVQAFK